MALFNDLNVGDAELLRDIQGNILRGYRRMRTLFCFVRFKPEVPSNREWVERHILASRAEFPVTSAARQASERKSLVNFMLTASGLERLGCPSDRMVGMDRAFLRTSQADETIDKLGDPALNKWEKEYQAPWDALILVACGADEADAVASQLRAIGGELAACKIEVGNVLDAQGAPRGDDTASEDRYEPFGYRDGISEIVFSAEHARERWAAQQQKQGLANPSSYEEKPAPKWTSERPLTVVLAPDPLEPSSFGSYFTFRKLAQDVQKFRDKVAQATNELLAPLPRSSKAQSKGAFLRELYNSPAESPLGIFSAAQPPDRATVGQFVKARIMGRFPDGTALTPEKNPPPDGFDYSDDRDGRVCPFHAHIRKMNPRGATGDSEAERLRSIIRRGIPYGRSDTAGKGAECGLLFLCAQRKIADQFEFHQASLGSVRDVDLQAEPTPGADNVSAQPRHVPDRISYDDDQLDRYKRYSRTIDVDVKAYEFVTLRGSAYLFAPSLPGLRALVTGGVQ